MNRWMLSLVFGLLAVGCADDPAPGAVTDSSFTKDQAAQSDGLADDGRDICELMGWYADDVCDRFCDGIDQDCDAVCKGVDQDCDGIDQDCDAICEGVDQDCDGIDQDCDGAIKAVCGGASSAKCPAGQFCDFAIAAECGSNDAVGTCAALPETCTNSIEPVCGCDGTTYNNACYANRDGVSVSTNSACETACATSTDCADGSFCVDSVCVQELPTTCNGTTACALGYFCYLGSADACNVSGDGVCQPTGEACAKNYDPVCGCDGTTYGNACQAAAAGANIEAAGECASGTVGCGARLGDTCQDTEFCSFTLLAGCGYADQTGVCAPKPQFCPENIDPVCGCDQMTYNNECDANTAGTSTYTAGACQTTCTTSRDCDDGQTCQDNICIQKVNICGGRSGGICDATTEWCNYGGAANLCGQFDAQGTCDPRPQICTAQYDPVCGCDGTTYGNSCEAHAAGVDIVSIGECAATL